MRFRRWVVFTFAMHVLVVVLDKGAGLVLFKLLEDQPAVKGGVDLLTSLPFLLTAVANLGLATAAVFFLRRGRFSLPAVAETTSLVALAWGGALALGIVLASQLLLPRLAPTFSFSWTYVLPIALCVPLLLTTSYLNSIQLAIDRVRDYNLVHVVASVAFLPLFLLYFLGLQAPAAESMAWGRLTSAALVAGVTLWLLRGAVRWRPRLHPAFLRAGLAYGWKANLTSALTYTNRRIDLYLLGVLYLAGQALLGPDELKAARLAQVAFYGQAVTFAELVWHFPEAMRDLFFSKVAGSSDAEARKLTPILCRICLWAAALGALGVFAVVDPVMSFISPTKWDEKWQTTVLGCLVVLSPGTVTYTIAKILQNDLAARGRLDLCLVACVLELVAIASLDALWIPEQGALGAAYASTTAFLLSSAYSLSAYRLSGGAGILQCLVPRPSDWSYVVDLVRAVREKVAKRSSA